jgi:crotonobetainyl-CoA:carnitine CoA-transferase CaiB-like acyl-CoA transferase
VTTGASLLHGIRVVEHSSGAAAAYAGRLLSSLGAETVLVEPPGGSPLRREPPFLGPERNISAVFAYLSSGKETVSADALPGLLADADVLIDDTPVAERAACGLDPEDVLASRANLVYVSVLPFGAVGPKASWIGSELNVFHASGEGFLLPNGLSAELFPDRPPLKIHGHFAEMQGGVAAAFAALASLACRDSVGGQFVDVSSQDATIAVGAFAVQRFGDGAVEHRTTRSFRYGGVIECADGYVELLTLEDRQWTALVELMGSPDWAADPAFGDASERSRRGAEINAQIRAWARRQRVGEVVEQAQTLGVPMASYHTPAAALASEHNRARGLFTAAEIAGVGTLEILSSPVQVSGVRA